MSSLQACALSRTEGAALADIIRVERDTGRMLPEDYKLVLQWSDGFEARIEGQYLALWSCKDLVRLNSDYQIKQWLPRLLAIGSDGGGECIALDYGARMEAARVVSVPFGDLFEGSIIICGPTLTDAVAKWLECSYL